MKASILIAYSVFKMIWSIGEIILTQENRGTWLETFHRATLSAINPTQIGGGSSQASL